MRLLSLFGFAAIATLALARLLACSCGFIHGRSALETLQRQEQSAAAIFEGVAERSQLQWNVLDAKEGALISGFDLGEKGPGGRGYYGPRMVITFRVRRAYKANLGQQVQVATGLGGGDCGAVFASGLTYLIYAGSLDSGQLGVSLCSPGGWIGTSAAAAELRYLRKERLIAKDLEAYQPMTAKQRSDLEQRDGQENQRRFAAATGQICGTVYVKEKADATGAVSFLSVEGYSPAEYPTASVAADGSFCSGRLGPGKYYLYFMSASGSGISSAVYYPGGADRAHAATVEVSAGQTVSGISFKVPEQPTYSVRGLVSIDQQSKLTLNGISISLNGLDGPFLVRYNEEIDVQSFFPLPKVKYFNFEHVLPGRYIVIIGGRPGSWSKKVEVDITAHMKFIFLELVNKGEATGEPQSKR